jgi:hypothetical protein
MKLIGTNLSSADVSKITNWIRLAFCKQYNIYPTMSELIFAWSDSQKTLQFDSPYEDFVVPANVAEIAKSMDEGEIQRSTIMAFEQTKKQKASLGELPVPLTTILLDIYQRIDPTIKNKETLMKYLDVLAKKQ